MIRKISGKQSNTIIHHLENNNDGTKITERVDIANRLAQEISKNSSSNNYHTEFQKYQVNAEKEHLDFDTDNFENYNVHLPLKNCDVLKKSHDTATGPDEIHYQLLKHLPRDSLMVLLDIFNDIWASGEIPECWKEATVIPIPKPGKDSKNPSNYRPISDELFMQIHGKNDQC